MRRLSIREQFRRPNTIADSSMHLISTGQIQLQTHSQRFRAFSNDSIGRQTCSAELARNGISSAAQQYSAGITTAFGGGGAEITGACGRYAVGFIEQPVVRALGQEESVWHHVC